MGNNAESKTAIYEGYWGQPVDRLQDSIRAQHPDFKRIFIKAKSIIQTARPETVN